MMIVCRCSWLYLLLVFKHHEEESGNKTQSYFSIHLSVFAVGVVVLTRTRTRGKLARRIDTRRLVGYCSWLLLSPSCR